jgi:DnaJ-class molecular chaperone
MMRPDPPAGPARPCPKCGGTGKAPGGKVKDAATRCGACRGTGKTTDYLTK